MNPALTAILTQIPTFIKWADQIVTTWKKYRNKKGGDQQPPSYRPRPAAMALFALLLASGAQAATTTVNLAWDANTEPDLAGYRLYQSMTTGGPYSLVQTLGLVTTTSVTGLLDGKYYWVLTAFDTVGNESGHSNEVTFLADTSPPTLPSTFRITNTVVIK